MDINQYVKQWYVIEHKCVINENYLTFNLLHKVKLQYAVL